MIETFVLPRSGWCISPFVFIESCLGHAGFCFDGSLQISDLCIAFGNIILQETLFRGDLALLCLSSFDFDFLPRSFICMQLLQSIQFGLEDLLRFALIGTDDSNLS